MKDFTKLGVEDYISMFWRRKWYALITAVVVTAGGVVYALRLPHIYRSQTTLLVQAQGISEGYVKPLDYSKVEERLGAVIQTMISRSLLERVVRGLKLYNYGENPAITMDVAVTALKDTMDVKAAPAGTIVVGFRSTKPALARDVTQRLAEEVIRSRSSSREEQATITDQFLDQQLRQAEKDLAVQEDKMKAFKTQYLGALPEQSATNVAALNGLHSQLINNESALQHALDQQLILEQRLRDLKRFNLLTQQVTTGSGGKGGSGSAAVLSPAARLNAQLDAKRKQLEDLELKYTDKFPDVARLKNEIQDLEQQLKRLPAENTSSTPSPEGAPSLTTPADAESIDASEITTQLAILKREIATRQKDNQNIQQQIQVYEGRLNLSPRVEQQLLSISRDYQSVKDHYQSLQDKRFNSQVAANLEKSNVNEVIRIIDPAYLPESPVGPNRRRIAMMGLLAGIALGLGLVVLLEFLDPTLGDEATASTELKLPVLISFPEMRTDEKTLSQGTEKSIRRTRSA